MSGELEKRLARMGQPPKVYESEGLEPEPVQPQLDRWDSTPYERIVAKIVENGEGIRVRPEARDLVREIQEVDSHFCGGTLDLKFGVNGDSADTLINALSLIFAARERQPELCEHCGCELAHRFGGLEQHHMNCPNFPY